MVYPMVEQLIKAHPARIQLPETQAGVSPVRCNHLTPTISGIEFDGPLRSDALVQRNNFALE